MARILIVDDEPAITGVLKVLVTGMGHEGVTCPGVAQAIQVLEQAPPVDLILSDLRMNPESGFDLLKTVKHRWPAIPVILITAFLSDENWREAKRLGAFAGVRKPFQVEPLRAQITAALAGGPPVEA